MKKIIYIVLAVLAAAGCVSTHQGSRSRPAWINNRPLNDAYYVGVGIASKTGNPNDYQQIAKKNALNDLISEIKVTVSTNSALSQFQSNKEFRQQFESDTRITALNTIENFEAVDSWENKDTYWVYYRLSRAEYESARRKKMLAALERAEDYYGRALKFDVRRNFMQALRLKIKAAVAVQDYLSEDLQTRMNGEQVYLINELVSSIQDQLYKVTLASKVTQLKGKVGKPISQPFDVAAALTDSLVPVHVPFLPLKMQVEQGRMEFGALTETDQQGIASFSVARITSKDQVQLIRILADMERIIRVDSMNQSLKNILLSVDVPSTAIRVNVDPIRVYIDAKEQNLAKTMDIGYIESVLKKNLADDGCYFVNEASGSDYIIRVRSNTIALGAIWGNMQQASLDMSLSLVESKNNAEVFKEALQNIKGFQTTSENAGVDAYKTTSEQLMKNIYPKLRTELLRQEE